MPPTERVRRKLCPECMQDGIRSWMVPTETELAAGFSQKTWTCQEVLCENIEERESDYDRTDEDDDS